MTGTKIDIFIDRGGTFTDCIGIPKVAGNDTIVVKLLSVDPSNYEDAPTEGIRRILETFTGQPHPRGAKLSATHIGVIRMGTTVATNALLERKGERSALLITKGFRDALEIGYQARPSLFELAINKPGVLYSEVVEVDERLTMEDSTKDPLPGGIDVESDAALRVGQSGDVIRILKPLDIEKTRQSLRELLERGIRSVCICLAHSYSFPDHENMVRDLAGEVGFLSISTSSNLIPMIKLISRGMSTTADAYLTPEIKRYVSNFRSGFKDGLQSTRCQFMQSDGGLVDIEKFSGLRAILSGPAGGVVGYAKTSWHPDDRNPVIGFDMGGTSTDVSRYGGDLDHVFETTTAGVTIQSPQLDIKTVASGGGSILAWKNGLFTVGPESASAHPGPACYRKGGPLTVTDANLFLGRLLPEYFPAIFGPDENLALDYEATKDKFMELTATINAETRTKKTPEEVALGFLSVANEAMCRPIRDLTEGKGFHTSAHRLAVFGGAGGQHACSIAGILGVSLVLIHKYSSILSAYGMALANLVSEVQEPSSLVLDAGAASVITQRFEALEQRATRGLLQQGVSSTDHMEMQPFLNLRYNGTDTQMMIAMPPDGDFKRAFEQAHQQEFTFLLPSRQIVVDDIRVRGVAKEYERQAHNVYKELNETEDKETTPPGKLVKTYFRNMGWVDAPVYLLHHLGAGDCIQGPAIIIDNTQTIVVTPFSTAKVLSEHVILSIGSQGPVSASGLISLHDPDPVQLSIFGHNVPVHLGSMAYAVKYQHERHSSTLRPGDVLVSNHPIAGGTHLPDITVITPVFDSCGQTIIFYTASRGHHRDIGGYEGISGNANATELAQEGASIISFKIVSNGIFDEDGITKILVDEPGRHPGCVGTSSLYDNLSDLRAQIAANAKGSRLIENLFDEYGREVVQFYMDRIQANAEVAVRKFLQLASRQFGGRKLQAVDSLDNGTRIHLEIRIDTDGGAEFDFTGTGPEVVGNNNAPKSICLSAIIYSLRCLINQEIPLNQGCLSSIRVINPEGCILNPSDQAAVYAGNTQTSQRVVDVILRAFEAAAASQGCMNSIGFFGGRGRKVGDGYKFAYGETICGGSGAGPGWHGASAVHSHMTNTRISDVEVLEKRYPIILQDFSIRQGSGGKGEYKGGDGVVRVIECRQDLTFSCISERRVCRPYGLCGGEDGAPGENLVIRKAEGKSRIVSLGPRGLVRLRAGDQFVIKTPGGGGYGSAAPCGGGPRPSRDVMAIIGVKEQHVDPRLSSIAKADTKKWYNKRNLRMLYLVLIPCALGVEWTSGFDSSMMNSLQAVESWVEYFGNPTEGRLGLLNAMYSLGALMAVPFVPSLSQYLGRRWTIATASLIMCMGAGLQAGSRNVDMFLASRWVLGFGIPFAIVNASSLIGELAYEKERSILTSLFNASWFVGAIVAAGVTYGTFQMDSTWAWRLPSLLQLLPSLCQLCFLPFCPESPRYLVSKDRGDEAYAILSRYHGEGDRGDEFVRLEFAQIQSTIAQEQATSSAFVWADVFRDPPMRRRFLIAAIVGFFTQWSGNGLLSFYMKKILDLVGIRDNRTVQQIILSNTCWGFINAVPIALVAPRYPRRTMFLTCTIGTAVVYTVWTVASARFAIENSARAAIPVLVFIFVYSPFYNIGWNALAYTYMVEIFPYQQRAKGIAVEQLTVRFAVFFNTYVNPIALDRIGWKYYIVYCVWIVVEISTVYVLFPETHNHTLEELSFMFEGKAIQDQVQSKVEKQIQVKHTL